MLMGEFINTLYGDTRFTSDPLFQRILHGGADLEYIFQELDDWKTKTYMKVQLPPPPNAKLYLDPNSFAKIPDDAAELGALLRRRVFTAYNAVDSKKTLQLFNELLEGIFTHLDYQKYPLVIFTTNYDPAVETYCEECKSSYELEDGFARGTVWMRQNLDDYVFAGKKKHLVLLKLHGSATWARKDERVVKFPFAVYAPQEGEFENVMIYPATNKVALNEPFHTAYDYFQRTMDSCGCCIVIGYSFRDYDALTKLASASALNPRLTLLVIDPNAEAICQALSKQGVRCVPLAQKFGEDIAFMHEVSEYVVKVQKGEDAATA